MWNVARAAERGHVEPMADERLSDAEYETLANLRYTLRRFMDFSASAAQAEGRVYQKPISR